MKCLIAYHSVTNSTFSVAKNIAEGLKESGIDTTLHNLNDDIFPDLEGFDIFGIGTPVYYFQIPINVIEFIEKLPDLSKIRTFAFLLNGSYAWNAGDMLKQNLVARGSKIEGWFYSLGADYYLGYNRLGCFPSYSHPTMDDLNRAKQFGMDMGKDSSDTKWPEISKKPPLMYKFEQIVLSPTMIKNYYQNSFKLNKQKCIKCNTCVKGCPVNNISSDDEGFPKWNKKCIFCLNCEATCPKGAISSASSSMLSAPVIKSNVKHILKDPSLEKVKVRMVNGKLEICENINQKETNN
ncbi:MAG: EFR1 family ferrodoxin [Sedimentibacter saalensis]|uniref:Flavodoxin n=1 Tax=Sedimentibacter saalensis TaxID=130788 RepID=A0A562JH77_9FIRM|nr:EFR1 family ferrodoxin [Sedimentibacter saalensis]MEA5094518.1 EFR1 family ferrodoxin [Sedimentibacter saalensis]TWH82549.1 flavodoxin [Sedimentibacter saalensis]